MKKILLVAIISVLSWGMKAWADEGAAIRGVVLNAESGQPILGASVTIPGVATAITDDVGRFELNRSEAGAVIQVRMMGFADKDLVVRGGEKELTIRLHDESFKTVFRSTYSPQGSKEWLQRTGAVTTITNESNYKKGATSPESLIQDEGLGVNTRIRSGMQGIGGNMFVWGFSSINASSQPMILVDGVPYENALVAPSLISGNTAAPLSGFEVKDIESITLLKDATSLYGSKGGNGVVLIETAKAYDKATKIDFYAYAGVNLEPSQQYSMMNAGQYRSYLYELMSGAYTPQQLQTLPIFDQNKPVIQKWGIEGNKDYYRYNQNTDWQSMMFQNSLSHNYYLTIKGGDDIAMYALSVGYMNHGGIMKTTDFSRYTTQFNSQLNITKWLRMDGNMSVSYNDRQLIYEGLSPNFNPLYMSLVKAPFMASYLIDESNVATPNLEQKDLFGKSNPHALIDDQTAIFNSSYRFFGNVGARAELGKGFEASALFGVTYDKSRERIFLPQTGLAHDPLPSGEVTNEMKAMAARYLQYYLDFHLSYKRTFDKEHSLSALVGMRYQTNSTEGDWVSAYNSSSDDLTAIGNGQIDLAGMSGVIGSWKWLSFYLNGEYSYLNRYFLSYNMALDASSRFGTEAGGLKMGSHVYGVFPSLTASWLVSSEDFMSGLDDKIDLLRLRVGYSVAGNDDIGNYSSRTSYTSQNIFGYYGLVRSNIANPGLKWETNTKLNLGVDVAVFNERLNLSVDLFQNKTTDLLTWQKGDGYIGIDQYAVNGGTMKNVGVELGIQGRVFEGVVKWDLGFNIGAYRNKVTALPQERSTTEIAGGNVLTQVGEPLGLFYGYKTNGVYATSQEAESAGVYYLRGDGKPIYFGAGDMRFVSTNDDKLINDDDMTVIGDPNPDFYGSIVSRVQWKRFTFSTVFTYSYGNDIYNALRAQLESMTGYENQTVAALNRWSREGHVTNMPRVAAGDPMGNSRFSDRWIEDGSYLRLKTLSLSYDIPLSINFIKGLQVYVTGNNLLTFTKYLGYDPEFSAQQSPLYYGIDMGVTPMPRSLLVGVKLGL